VTQVKIELDGKVRFVQRSKKSLYYYPNESILLLYTHWPFSFALSRTLTAYLLALTFTIRPNCNFTQEGTSNCKLLSNIKLPITLPTTPPKRYASAGRSTEMRGVLPTVKVEKNAGNIVSLNNISIISIENDQLSYSHSINLSTPSFYLQLNNLSFILDFVQVTSGYLSVMRVGKGSTKGTKYCSFDITDIPTTTAGVTINCPPGSNEFLFQLKSTQREILLVVFEWGSDESICGQGLDVIFLLY